jgi:hypothetical protein
MWQRWEERDFPALSWQRSDSKAASPMSKTGGFALSPQTMLASPGRRSSSGLSGPANKERSSLGPDRREYTSSAAVLKATPASY